MTTSPSTELYMLGRGILKFDRFDSAGLPTGLRDVGNSPNFTLVPTQETLDHFSSRSGVKKKDKTVTLSVGLGVKFTLEEYDKENLALALFGEVIGASIALLTRTTILGKVVFTGKPDQGPWFTVTLHRVTLKVTSEVPLIGDDWGKVDFEGTVEDDTANNPTTPYGTMVEVIKS